MLGNAIRIPTSRNLMSRLWPRRFRVPVLACLTFVAIVVAFAMAENGPPALRVPGISATSATPPVALSVAPSPVALSSVALPPAASSTVARSPAGRSPATTARATPWRSVSDTIFHAVARGTALPDSGLPRAVAQDGAGFIWIGTDAGLARWDGQGFRNFTNDPEGGSDSGAILPEPLVNVLHTDTLGRLWIGMSSEGVLRYDAATDRFLRPVNPSSLDHDHVVAIADDGRGGIWVGSDQGLTRVDADRHADRSVGKGLAAGQVTAIARGATGTLWVAVGGRLFVRMPGAGRFRAFPLRSGPGNADRGEQITDLHVDRRSRLWVATAARGALVVDPVDYTTHDVRLPAGAPVRLGAIVEDGAGDIWIASRSGVFKVDPVSLVGQRFGHDATLEGSLVEDGINDMIRDRNGMIWIVGDASLSYADLRPGRASSIVGALGFGSSGNRYDAWSVAVAPNGTIWTGSTSERTHVISASPGARNPATLGAGGKGVAAIAFAPGRGAFLAGEEGLDHLALDGHLIRRISTNRLNRLLVDGDTLFAGGDDGVASLDLRDDRAQLRPERWSSRLSNRRIRAIVKAPDGALWIGTARGLNRVDARTGAVFRMMPERQTPRGLDGSFVSTLLFDRFGRLWAGTIGGGLNVIVSHGGGWWVESHVKHGDGLPHNTVDKLLPAPDGAIWASTDGGIARIDPQTLAIDPLQPSDGVAFAANWTNAGDVLPDGNLVFAGFGGLTIVDTRAGRQSLARTPIRITGVKIDDKPVHGVATPLVIQSRARSLQVDFAALDYAAARELTYAYRLRDFEKDWTRTDSLHRSARYTNLPPGKFVLEVRASTGNGVLLPDMLRLPVTVEAEWHETIVVRLIALALVVVAILLLTGLRARAAERRQQMLEEIVERRTVELRSSQRAFEKLANTDTLTGLANRRLYGEVVARLLSRPPQDAAAFGLVLLDLDRFKHVNDAFGHDVGDALLIEVADRLTQSVRKGDQVFRLGGDEFAMILPGVDRAGAVDFCERVVAALAVPMAIAGETFSTTLSIGIALFPRHGDTSEALYKAADRALYDAKAAGRNTWRILT